MPKYVKVQGTWKAVDESADCGKIKVNGVWRTVSHSYVKVAGVWKAVCSPVVITATTTTTTAVTVPATTATTAQPYPNIGTVIAYGAGAGQTWTSNAAYITWGGSGWGSYTVIASNGSSGNNPSSAGGPPVLLTGFSANTSYSVTVTLFANANYSGQSASSSTSFTTGAVATTSTTSTTTTTTIANCGIMPNVIGLTNSQASDAIVARGIAYEYTNYTSVGATAQNDNTVQAQDPAPGTNVGSCDFSYNAGLTLYSYTPPTTGTTSTTTPTTTTTTTTTSTTTTTTSTTTTPTSCTMPSVVGLSETAASNAIVNAGIAYEFTYEYGNAQGATAQNNNTVAAQDPAPGTVGTCNYTVNATLYVYRYTAPATTTVATTAPATTTAATTAPATTTAATTAPATTTTQNCNGIRYVFQGEPGYMGFCDGYASIFNNCGVFLGCND